MEIRILTPLVTTGAAYGPGDVTTWPDAKDAQRLIKAGFAEPVKKSEPKTEKS